MISFPLLLRTRRVKMTCAILAGGLSRRMGRDKAAIQIGNRTLLRRTYDVAKSVFSEILVVSSVHRDIGGIRARIVKDIFPVSGSMTGIVSALINADTPYVFVLGCDMPFITEEAIRYMIGEVHGEDIIIPKTEDGFEPVHAIYNRSCIAPLLSSIEQKRMKISSPFAYFCVKTLPSNPLFFSKGVSIFTNLNTREDLSRAEDLCDDVPFLSSLKIPRATHYRDQTLQE